MKAVIVFIASAYSVLAFGLTVFILVGSANATPTRMRTHQFWAMSVVICLALTFTGLISAALAYLVHRAGHRVMPTGGDTRVVVAAS